MTAWRDGSVSVKRKVKGALEAKYKFFFNGEEKML